MPDQAQNNPEEQDPNRDYTHYLNRHLDEEEKEGKDVKREGYDGHWDPDTVSGTPTPGEPARYEGYIPDDAYGGSYTGFGAGPNSRSDNRQTDAGTDLPGSDRDVGLGSGPAYDPENLRPSDRSIREEILTRFAESPQVDARTVQIEVEGGEVTLSGRVPDEPTRRLAEAMAESTPGVLQVTNRLSLERT